MPDLNTNPELMTLIITIQTMSEKVNELPFSMPEKVDGKIPFAVLEKMTEEELRTLQDNLLPRYNDAVKPPEPKGLLPRHYKQAIDIQDACNLSGVVHGYSRMMNKIWEEATMNQKSTDWVNHHPIAVLFAEKCAHLATGLNIVGNSAVDKAWSICEEKSKE